jgi:hypothetical protein
MGESQPLSVAASDSPASLLAQNSDETKCSSLADAVRRWRRMAGGLSTRRRVAGPCERLRCIDCRRACGTVIVCCVVCCRKSRDPTFGKACLNNNRFSLSPLLIYVQTWVVKNEEVLLNFYHSFFLKFTTIPTTSLNNFVSSCVVKTMRGVSVNLFKSKNGVTW